MLTNLSRRTSPTRSRVRLLYDLDARARVTRLACQIGARSATTKEAKLLSSTGGAALLTTPAHDIRPSGRIVEYGDLTSTAHRDTS